MFVVWESTRACGPFGSGDSGVYFNRSLDGGATWLPNDVRLDTGITPAAPSFRPKMTSSGSSVYVIWEQTANGGHDVYFNRTTDAGTTWLPVAARLNSNSPASSVVERPAIAVSGTTVHVVWLEPRNSSSFVDDVYYTRSLDRGQTWASEVLLPSGLPAGTVDMSDVRLAVSGASVYVAWLDPRAWTAPPYFENTDIWLNRSLDAGVTWMASPVHVGPTATPGTVSCLEPNLVADGQAVTMVWRDLRNGNWDVYANRSVDRGATWLARAVRVDTGTAPGTAFSLLPVAVASGSLVGVAWLDGRAGPWDVYFNRSLDSGTTWATRDVRLVTGTEPGQTGSNNAVLAASGPAVYVAWEESGARGGIRHNIPFGFAPYGSGTAGAGGFVPRTRGSGPATLGGSVTVAVDRGLGGAPAALLVGVGPSSRVAVPVLGGTLLVTPAASVPLVLGGSGAGGGSAAVNFSVPVDPALIGAPARNVNFQALVLDPGAAQQVSMSDGLELWMG